MTFYRKLWAKKNKTQSHVLSAHSSCSVCVKRRTQGYSYTHTFVHQAPAVCHASFACHVVENLSAKDTQVCTSWQGGTSCSLRPRQTSPLFYDKEGKESILRNKGSLHSETMRDYEETTAFLGQWGRFQQVVFFLLCASILPNGFGAFSVVFLTDIPSHHCLVPEINLTQEWRIAIIPIKVNI